MIFRCQPGYELYLERELRSLGLTMTDNGSGWITTNTPATPPPDLCFAHTTLLSPSEITGESVNALAARILEKFFETARTERFETAWPISFDTASGLDGLGRRADAVEKAFAELLRKRMSRVAKLATPNLYATGAQRGLFVFFTDFQRAHLTREILRYGQRRMADDFLAPSRSYLKVEEAYGILGREPAPDETVVDLGAAPGGWSYSAAKRGARVVAVDNGPLKAGALDNPLIAHLQQDAFHYDPITNAASSNAPADWLFCDLVEDPHHVLENILVPWIERRWCKRYIVNLKFGRVDPVALLDEVRKRIPSAHVRHLYHDREEFTIVGEVNI